MRATMLYVAETLLTVQQVAERLQVHPDSVRRWIEAGLLAAYRLPGRRAGWRIEETAVQEFLEKRRGE